MAFELITLAVCVFALLAGSSQARDQASALPPALALAALPHHPDSSAPPHRTEAPWGDASQQTHTPAASASHITTIAWTDGTVHSGTTQLLTSSALAVASSQHTDAPTTTTTVLPGHPSPSGDSLSSTPTNSGRTTPPQYLPTGSGAPLTKDPPSTVSSRPAHATYETHSPAHTSTFRPRSESPTTVTAAQPAATGHHVTPTTGRGPAGPTHQEAPSELNVGDEDPKGHRLHPSSPLDPLMAGLLSVFIVTTAIVFIVLFLKFRQRTNHPEFHRLQDLPMDDLMEDTPLSRYTY